MNTTTLHTDLNLHFRSSANIVLTILLVVLTVLVSVPPILGVTAPLWLQPTLVGAIWATLFLQGFGLALAADRSPWTVLLAMPVAALSTAAFRRITDLTMDESMLLAVLLVGSGWAALRIDRIPCQRLLQQCNQRSRVQLPLIDFFIVTALVACGLRAVFNISSSPMLLSGVIGTLVVGSSCCWAAYHWAWDDGRPVGLPVLMTLLLSVSAICVVIRISPLTTVELASWLLTGPLSVLAAQTFIVLLAFAALRFQVRLHRRNFAVS